MASRILTLQRQARELGRLRTGTYNGRYPERSDTWIVTSHAEHYVQAAADLWRGSVEKWQPLGNGAQQWRVVTEQRALDAILPPGDPLSQSYELWSKGGCQRRCDGMSEELSGSPCICRATWGEGFHQVAPKDAACKMTTRLNVILPEMPDIGAWRVETHSYHSANEMAAAVDVMKGAIGQDSMIPIRLRIEQRTRVTEGKTKQFPVVAVELRGATAGELLAGAMPKAVLEADGRAAIEPVKDYVAAIAAATTREEVRELWRAAKDARVANGPEVEAAAKARVADLEAAEQAAETSTPSSAPEPDAEQVWQRLVQSAPAGWTLSALEDAFLQRNKGVHPSTGTGAQLAEFADAVTGGWINPPAGEAVPF
jgi:hypothetical protein